MSESDNPIPSEPPMDGDLSNAVENSPIENNASGLNRDPNLGKTIVAELRKLISDFLASEESESVPESLKSPPPER